jgi:hypothetical protein
MENLLKNARSFVNGNLGSPAKFLAGDVFLQGFGGPGAAIPGPACVRIASLSDSALEEQP